MTSDPPAAAATPTTGVDPSSLSLEQLARLLTGAGGKTVSVDDLRADFEAGAPMRADGRVHLVHYAAWLARDVQGTRHFRGGR